ncbi:MAG: 4-phosphopantetheinyl transferase [Bacteroidetes bacterium]|nr:4-phosphopantetheinyl transferase [Bacteroidota bacterium]
MIKVKYVSIHAIKDEKMHEHISALPATMEKEINRYHTIADRKSRLLGRLMLKDSVGRAGLPHLIGTVSRNVHNKPCIKGWDAFNISHSGEMVVFAHSRAEIGIDIEKAGPLDHESLLHNLHPKEQELVRRSADPQQEFYHIWVKKEALLKAVGTGLMAETELPDCSGSLLSYKGMDWRFHLLGLAPGYICYLCAPASQSEISIDKFLINTGI